MSDLRASWPTRIRAQRPVALATVIDGPQRRRASCSSTPTAIRSARSAIPSSTASSHRDALRRARGRPLGRPPLRPEGQTTPEDLVDTPVVSVFVESWAPPPQMWIFGAVDFTAALAKVAKVLGYRVTVCDAREIFATRRRFPMADEVRVTWPGPMFDERGASARAARRGVHPHPRPEVRRARRAGRAGHRGRLHRRDGQPHHARQAHGATAPRSASTTPPTSTG